MRGNSGADGIRSHDAPDDAQRFSRPPRYRLCPQIDPYDFPYATICASFDDHARKLTGYSDGGVVVIKKPHKDRLPQHGNWLLRCR